MIRYSIEPRDQIFVTGYRFFPFLKNFIKNLSKKCSQKLLNQAKKSVTDTIKTNQKSN